MKRMICALAMALTVFPAVAKGENNTKSNNRDEVLVTVGTYAPTYGDLNADVMTGIHYGHSWSNGLGLRVGLQYTAETADISNQFGLPVALTFKTRARSTSQRIQSGIYGAAGALETELYSGWTHNTSARGTFGNILSAFLLNLFDRMEFQVGLTPGYIQGASSGPHYSHRWNSTVSYSQTQWTEKQSSFYLTADIGFALNFRIWRFNIKLMPAYHWNITDNYVLHSVLVESGPAGETSTATHQTIGSFFSFCGGLSFEF